MRLPVFDIKGKRTQTILEFDEHVFGDRVREVVLKDAILMYEARQRLGTHSTKTRKDCSGSTRKAWRQKGTGRARTGPARAPHWRGGGTVFGPHPRDYSYSMPKKAKRVALNSAWLAKLMDKEVMVVDGFDIDEKPKTAKMVKSMQEMGIQGLKVLFGTTESNETLWKSLRNIPKTSLEKIACFNPYILIAHDRIIIPKKSFEELIASRGGAVKTLERKEVYS